MSKKIENVVYRPSLRYEILAEVEKKSFSTPTGNCTQNPSSGEVGEMDSMTTPAPTPE